MNKNIIYDFDFELVDIPTHTFVETKKGGFVKTSFTEDLFKDAVNLAIFQYAWAGTYNVEVVEFDSKKRYAKVHVHYEYLPDCQLLISKEGHAELFRSSLAVYSEYPDKVNKETNLNERDKVSIF